MSFRKAGHSDIPAMMRFARLYHLDSPHADEPFNESLYTRYLEGFLNRSDARLYISDYGVMGCVISYTEVYNRPFLRPSFFRCEKGKSAELMQALECFASQNGNIPIVLSSLSKDGKPNLAAARLYARQGYRVAETHYVRGF